MKKMKLDMVFTNTKMIYQELNMTDRKLIKMKEGSVPVKKAKVQAKKHQKTKGNTPAESKAIIRWFSEVMLL
jgi:hypothetical protein